MVTCKMEIIAKGMWNVARNDLLFVNEGLSLTTKFLWVNLRPFAYLVIFQNTTRAYCTQISCTSRSNVRTYKCILGLVSAEMQITSEIIRLTPIELMYENGGTTANMHMINDNWTPTNLKGSIQIK